LNPQLLIRNEKFFEIVLDQLKLKLKLSKFVKLEKEKDANVNNSELKE